MFFRIVFIAVLAVDLQTADSFNPFDEDLCERICPTEILECAPECPPAPPCPRPECPKFRCPVPKCPVPRCPPFTNTSHCPARDCPVCPYLSGNPCPVCPTPNPSCLKLRKLEETPTCPPCPPCLSDYKTFGNIGAYKLYRSKVTWKRANKTCLNDGGYLAVPQSEVELQIMLVLMNHELQGEKVVHIGMYGNDDVTTVRGEPLNYFQESLWRRGFPKIGSYQDSVLLGEDGKIWNFYNVDKEAFLCQLPKHKSVLVTN